MLRRTAFICLVCLSVNGHGNTKNVTSIGYDPGELLAKIFPSNLTQSRAGYGFIKFENQFKPDDIVFYDQSQTPTNKKPIKFEDVKEINQIEDNSKYNPEYTNVRFDNSGHFLNMESDLMYDYNQGNPEIGINDSTGYEPQTENKPDNGQKRKRRRRKPKKIPNQPGYLNQGYPGLNGPIAGPVQGFGPNFQPGFNGQVYRPPRRPRPSIASDALSAVTGALGSIAQNDDYQCVARLLCEAAANRALGGSSILESISGLQPLLTLLSAYNGISSNPLFVFGRAAFLGMSSKNNPGSCRYAYPLCPTDPEQLVHYLNNHNGGFFRFFNAPQLGQQNVEQFYNQLSQNYGLYQPNPGPNQEYYGLLNPGQFSDGGQQPNLYPNGHRYQQNYGLGYPYNQNYVNGNGIRFKNDKDVNDGDYRAHGNDSRQRIEKRIQNKPANSFNDNTEDHNSKWLFPGEDDDEIEGGETDIQYVNYNHFNGNDDRKVKTLRFPGEDSAYDYGAHKYTKVPKESNRKPKGISFPESQSTSQDNNNYYHSNYPNYNNDNFVFYNMKRGIINYNYPSDNYNSNNNNNQDEPGVTTVYVVRGNGDPSKPEIVKLRPGETL